MTSPNFWKAEIHRRSSRVISPELCGSKRTCRDGLEKRFGGSIGHLLNIEDLIMANICMYVFIYI